MARLLVLGVDTALGGNLALALSDRCEVLGLYDQVAVQSAAVHTARWSHADPESLTAHFDTWQPQWVLHCGSLAASSWEVSPAECDAHCEQVTSAHLADFADRWGSSLTILSSDAVFAGPRMFHDERWPASRKSPRANHTLAMEQAVAHRDALLVRTHAYGWGSNRERPGFAEWAVDELRTGRFPAADGRRYATPILATDLAELLWRAYETRLRGLYHIAGAERTSMHRFLAELAASLGIESSTQAIEEHGDATSHEETSLSSKRARRMLAAATPMLRDGLDRFVAQASNGWRDAWRPVERTRPVPETVAA